MQRITHFFLSPLTISTTINSTQTITFRIPTQSGNPDGNNDIHFEKQVAYDDLFHTY